MDKKLVVVEVQGGVVQNTNAPDDTEVWVVDYDNEKLFCNECGASDYYPDYSKKDWFICNACSNIFTNIKNKKPGKYIRAFDKQCPQWSKDPQTNLFFLKANQNYANNLLKARGHLYLNEVHDFLGLSRTKEGQIVGWEYDGEGDNFVDFGIQTQEGSSRIILNFNVDGVILDLDGVMEDKKQVHPNPEILVEYGKGDDNFHIWCDKKLDEKIRTMPGIYKVNDVRFVDGYLSVYVDHRYNKDLIIEQIKCLK